MSALGDAHEQLPPAGINRGVRGMAMLKMIETVFLGPGDVCCNALGVGQDNNRDLVRMLINSLVWMAVGGVVMAWIV
jgi:hypothetical protein